MSIARKSNYAHLLVGCGGSGAKTIAATIQLMANDPRWRNDLDEYIFVLLVDTNDGDLNKYTKQIRGTGPNLTVERMLITDGFARPSEIVNQFKLGIKALKTEGEKRKAIERFSKHWWVEHPEAKTFDEAKPWKVDKARDVQLGAGQAPMVSFIAAWQALKNNRGSEASLHGKIETLVDKIVNIKAPMSNDQDDTHGVKLDVTFIGSVAGGTGRGCAIPIALKVKEVLIEKNQGQINCAGYFFNDDVFENVDPTPTTKLAKKFNAITGWSELDAWHEIGESTKEYQGFEFGLPSPSRPDDESCDSLRLEVEGGTSTIKPFETVGILCAQAGKAQKIEQDRPMYDMLAAALYANLTALEIVGKDNNEKQKYRSVGSATVEVDIEPLDGYFRDYARFEKCQQLRKKQSDEEVNNLARLVVDDKLGLSEAAFDKVIKYTGEIRIAKQYREGGVLERFAVKVSESTDFQAIVTKFGEALGADDLARVTEFLRKSVLGKDLAANFAKLASDCYESSLGEVLKNPQEIGVQIDRKNRETLARTIVQRLFLDTHNEGCVFEKVSRSVSATRQVALAVASLIDEKIKPKGLMRKEAVDRLPADAKDISKKVKEASKREHVLFGRRFSQDEQIQLKQILQQYLMAVAIQALGAELAREPQGKSDGGLLARMRIELDGLAGNCAMVVAGLDSVADSAGLDKARLIERGRLLFADRDRPEESLPNVRSDGVEYMVRRVIKPIRPNEQDLEPKNAVLDAFVLESLLDRSQGGAGTVSTKPSNRFKYELREKVLQSVLHKKRARAGEGEASIEIRRCYTLREVLDELKPFWEKRLALLYFEDKERFSVVEQSFRNFFGLKVATCRQTESGPELDWSEDDGVVEAAPDNELLLGLTMMAVRNCRPYWSLDATPTVNVMVPDAIDNTKSWQEVIKRGSKGVKSFELIKADDNRFAHGQKSEDRFNEYALVVSCTGYADSLEDVTSIRWDSDSAITTALQNAERTEPLMPFQPKENYWRGYADSGFSSPFYLTNQYALKRWKPWADAQAVASGDLDDYLIALSYALLGPDWMVRELEKEEGSADSLKGLQGRFFLSIEQARSVGKGSGRRTGAGDPAGPILEVNRRGVVLKRRPRQFAEQVGAHDGLRAKKVEDLNFVAHELEIEMVPGNPVATDLSAMRDALTSGGGKVEMRVLGEKILMEYQTFIEEVGYARRFSKDEDSARFATLIQVWKQQALAQEKKAAKDLAVQKFWTEAGRALGRLIEVDT